MVRHREIPELVFQDYKENKLQNQYLNSALSSTEVHAFLTRAAILFQKQGKETRQKKKDLWLEREEIQKIKKKERYVF